MIHRISEIKTQGEALGEKSAPAPFLEPNTEANTMGSNMLLIGRVPLREQVSYFERSIDYMVRMIGENGTEEMLKKAILIITIGSNDILNYYIQPTIYTFLLSRQAPH
ncbi:hypothetical protein IGI04_015773 [Brassica rapa subsp. trilocularis]|uniref:SGNH hydrolase-type esterase domain-containing protein n=1 Tax=Brassica rapa subsp. trilocularis TaxID=1813537 RepID=A0ABQ7MU04_BRACM|nr:hypothetical protein IGI04_015773 [Brassica rapa subsp. trilocularis]